MHRLVLSVLVAWLALPAPAHAANVAGTLPADTTWTAAGGPWNITGDVTVPTGRTLTIEAGAQVTFATGDTMGAGSNTTRTELIVDGTLLVQGTAASGVTITATNGHGVFVNGTANLAYATIIGAQGFSNSGNATLGFVTIRNANYCLRNTGGTLNVSNSIFTACSQPAVMLSGVGSTATLAHNTIISNLSDGIDVGNYAGNVTIIDTIVTSNSGYGIDFNGASTPTRVVHHNDVWGNGSGDHYGVAAGAGSLSTNPLLTATYRATENSPVRLAASDGGDIGAFPYTSDATPGLAGRLYANRTLTGANTLTGDLTVSAGVTLTLAAGATLTFPSSTDVMRSGSNVNQTELIVDGTLVSQGTAANGVTITATNAYGTIINGAANLAYTTFTGGGGFINAGNSALSFATFKNSNYCLRNTGGTLNVTNSIFTACSQPAVMLSGVGSTATLSHNAIISNLSDGVDVANYTGNVTIIDTIVTSNSGYGIDFNGASTPTRVVHHNDVWGNGSGDYYGVAAGAGSISTNPLLTATYRATETSPVRLAASDGGDIGAFPYTGDATTGLAGRLYANRTLTGANTLTGDLTVSAGVTLTLAAGATLTFPSSTDVMRSGANVNQTELIVDGTLVSQGTAANGVTITATNAYGTIINGAANLAYTTFTGGGGFINAGNSALSFATFKNSNYCLRNTGGTLNVTNSIFTACSQPAVMLSGAGSTATLTHNTLISNLSDGVDVANYTGNVTIIDTIVTSNSGYGIDFNGASTPTRTVHHNDVWGNGSGDHYGVAAGTGSLSTNPLLTAAYRATENSPVRLAASDGGDIGAFPYTSDATPGLAGRLYANRTLTGANTLTGDLTVSAGVTLTLAAGATLTFPSSTDVMRSGANVNQTELIVDGTLVSQGTAANGVTITATNAYGTIINGSATLAYTTFTGGGGFINAGNSALSFATFKNSNYCLRNTGGTLNVTNSIFTSCSQPAVMLSGAGSTATLTHNTLISNLSDGVDVANYTGNVTIIDTIVTSNSGYGIDFNGASTPTRVVHHNDVWGNGSGDYYGVAAGAGSISTNPLLTAAYRATENSPVRLAASDGGDIGAFPYTSDPTPGLAGRLYANRTLTGANTLTGDLTVSSGVTLTLAPGATLTFPSSTDVMRSGANVNQTELIVDGSLVSQGTATSGVTITATNAYGTIINGSANLAYTTFTGGGGFINAGNSALSFVTFRNSNYCLRNTGGTLNVSNSVFTTCSQPAVMLSGAGSTVTFAHNTIAGNLSDGVDVANYAGNVTIIDSIVASNSGYGIDFNGASTPTRTVHHNDVWSNGSGNFYGVAAGTGSLSANPLFASSTDFHLQATSPARGTASDGGDMGAFPYELLTASVQLTPAAPTLAAGATQQFSATAFDQSSQPIPGTTFTWASTAAAGTISPAGLYTATCTPGTYANAISATGGGRTGTTGVTVTVGPPSTVTITPATASVMTQATQQFVAVVKDSCGNTLGTPVTWSVAGGGTINSGGVFTASTTPGIYSDAIRATAGGVTGTATVTVQGAGIASLSIAPTTAELTPGQQQTFTATARDANGNTLPATITWSVAGGAGTITSGGVFTAGTTLGTYTDSVTATTGAFTARASVTVVAGALATLTITPASPNVAQGATRQFTAVGRDASGNVVPATVTWSVVAGGGSINSGGLFTAGTVAGTFNNTIRAASGAVSATTNITVDAGALSRIDITPASTTLQIGASAAFSAVGRDTNGNAVAATITWSAPTGGTISAGGVFTAGNVAGTFANAVRATSGSISATASVTVQAGPLASLRLTPATVTLGPGAMHTFTAVGADAAGNAVTPTVTWSAPAGGTVDTSGRFTAGTTAGTYATAVRATSGSFTATAAVTIEPGPIATTTLDPATSTIAVGGKQTFSATARDAHGNVVSGAVTWSVVAGGGAIAQDGTFTAGTTPGTYANTVRATIGGVAGLATVVVQAGGLATIQLSPSVVTLRIGQTQQFSAVGKDAAGNAVSTTFTWSTTGGGTISSSGLFSAGTTPGTYANAVRVVGGGLTAFADVTVTAGAIDRIVVAPASAQLRPTARQQFTARALDAAGNEVATTLSWSVTAGGGSIDATGLFTAGVNAASYPRTVRVTAGSVNATADIDVVPGPADTVTLTPRTVTLVARRTQQFRVNATDAWGNAVTEAPLWTITTPGAGLLDANGLFTASGRAGSYPGAVSATVGGLTGTADVTVQAGPLARIVIDPATATVAAGRTMQFNARGFDADDNAVSLSPVWTVASGAGRVSETGLFTAALIAGNYVDGVRATVGALTGSAHVVVTTGTPTRLAISPENPTVAVGRTVQFQVRALDEFGNEIGGSDVEWSIVAGGGTIDANGLFTACLESGIFGDTVLMTSGSLEAKTSLTIAEDFDEDGLADEWEHQYGFDPTNASDATEDPDSDGLTNLQEQEIGSDPRDGDSDDDGLGDSAERLPGEDTDGDTLPNVLDPDSDNDGLFDGTEAGVVEAPADTDLSKETFIADEDPATSTDPLSADTDGDGYADGSEDANHNGRVDPGESDPNVANAPSRPREDPGCGCGSMPGGASALWFALLALARRRRRTV